MRLKLLLPEVKPTGVGVSFLGRQILAIFTG